MRSICWELVELHLVKMLLMVTMSVANKMKPHSVLWAMVSNSMSWIFQSIQLKLLVNMCHYTFCCKHIVVPSVTNGNSMKLRSPFVCCSVAESLFCECKP